jgi:signal peptidase I
MSSSLHSSPVEETVSGTKETHTGGYGSLILFALVALGLALFVRMWIAAPYIVSGASMIPTFESWHYLIIDKVTYNVFHEPERGDIIVMRYPYDESRTFIKRVIGLPGETVSIQNSTITILNDDNPEGFVLPEPYLSPENLRDDNMTVTLNEGQYFVLGDNRKASADSRSWGTLPREDVVGKVLFRLFPVSLVSLYPGEARYDK